jgi:hypothetical protein
VLYRSCNKLKSDKFLNIETILQVTVCGPASSGRPRRDLPPFRPSGEQDFGCVGCCAGSEVHSAGCGY